MKRALVFTDGKAGHENQSKAFARALALEAEVVEIHFRSGFHKALSYLFDHLGIHTMSLLKFADQGVADNILQRGNFDVVIGTGSGTFYAAKSYARHLGVKCAVVLYPRGYRISTFDCVLAPEFDQPSKAPNVIEIPANLVANDESFYEKGIAAYFERTSVKPDISVIVGGSNKCSTMTAQWMRKELDRIFALPGTKAVTTSRRTPPEVEALIDSYPWDYKLIYSRDHFNPIPAFVKLSRTIFVTAESTGMLSEVCTFGSSKVVALDNLHPGPHKFRRFVENLRRGGYVDGSRKIDLADHFAAARKLL